MSQPRQLQSKPYEQLLIKSAANIGVTYGAPSPEYGAGHAAPGRAIAELLKTDPEFSAKHNVEEIPITWEGSVGDFWRKRNFKLPESTSKRIADQHGLISTGFGASEYQWEHGPDGKTRVHTPKPTAMFNLDTPHSNTDFSNYALKSLWHSPARPFVHWGPEGTAPDIDNLVMNRLKTGIPAGIRRIAGDPIHGTREIVGSLPIHIQELLSGATQLPVYSVGKLSPAIKPSLLRQLEQPSLDRTAYEDMLKQHGVPESFIQNKPVIAISGSGRGDFVGSRAFDMSKYLHDIGDNDARILAYTGMEREKPIRDMIGSMPEHLRKRIHTIGKLPQQDYVASLRGPSNDPRFLHYGSSGASSALESMLGGGKTMLPGDIRGLEGRANTIAKEMPHGVQDHVSTWMVPAHRGAQADWASRGLPLGSTPQEAYAALHHPTLHNDAAGAALKAHGDVSESQKNFKGLMDQLFTFLERKGKFPNAKGQYLPSTHNWMFSMLPKRLK